MAKRMVIMLVAAVVVIAGLGFVKFRQIKAMIAVYAVLSAAARSGDDDRRRTGAVAADAEAPSGPSRRSAASRSAPICRASSTASCSTRASTCRQGDMLVELDTRQERAQLSRRGGRSGSRARQSRTHPQPGRQRVISQAEFDKADAERKGCGGQRGRDPRDDRPQDDPRAVLRRARHPAGQPRRIPRAGRGHRVAPGGDPVYVNFAVPQQQLRLFGRRHGQCARCSRAMATRARAGSPPWIRSSIQAPATRRFRRRLRTPTSGCGRACSSDATADVGADRVR